jgi:hypothetical protein
MNLISKIGGALRFVANHPVNRGRKFRAVTEYGFIQVAARMIPGEICVEFPNNTRLLISPRMKGAAHFILPGLCEFEEMAFTMHFLRPDELFADVGANVGAFSVLAGSVAGARVKAFEPSADTFKILERNLRLNGLQDRAKAIHAAVGKSQGGNFFQRRPRNGKSRGDRGCGKKFTESKDYHSGQRIRRRFPGLVESGR